MTYYATGGSPALEHRSAVISAAAPGKMWAAVRMRVANNTNKTGTGTIARIGNPSGGIAWSLAAASGQTLINANCRVLVNGASSIKSTSLDPLYVVEGTWYEFITFVDTTTGLAQIYRDNVLWAEFEALEGETWAIWGTNIIGLLAGPAVTDKSIEFSHLYGCIGGVLTEAECLSFSIANDDPSELTAPPTHGWVPTGANLGDAATITAAIGGVDLVQTAGSEYPDPGYPYFVAEIEGEVLSDFSVNVTATTATLSAVSSTNTGTLYILGDDEDNFTTSPTATNIVDGVLPDGTTPASISVTVDMTGQTSFEELIEGLLADTGYVFYVVQDIDNAGDYSNVVSAGALTKRPIVGPSEEYVWLAADGEILASETGMEVYDVDGNVLVTNSFSTNSEGQGVIDLTQYFNANEVDYDIDSPITLAIYRTGTDESLVLRDVIVREGIQ